MWSLQKLMIFIELIHCVISCSFDIGIFKHISVELKAVHKLNVKSEWSNECTRFAPSRMTGNPQQTLAGSSIKGGFPCTVAEIISTSAYTRKPRVT